MTKPSVGITREVLLAELAASSDHEMRKYGVQLAKSRAWDPDKLFKMLAKALGKDPKELLK